MQILLYNYKVTDTALFRGHYKAFASEDVASRPQPGNDVTFLWLLILHNNTFTGSTVAFVYL